MKPFDPTKPVQQRCGRAARIICTDARTTHRGKPYPLIVEYAINGEWLVSHFSPDGLCFGNGPSDFDLINIPETKKIKFWVNVYPEHYPLQSIIHKSKEEADSKKGIDRFACIEIEREVKEGEGL